jgi:hypothetical protein
MRSDTLVYQKEIRISMLDKDLALSSFIYVTFQQLKVKLIKEFSRRGFTTPSLKENAITFCNKKGTCYSLSLKGQKIRYEVSVWDKKTLTAKSELIYGSAEEIETLIICELIENDLNLNCSERAI